MALDKRKKNINWVLSVQPDGQVSSTDQAILAVLMDLRDELKRLNQLLHCSNFQNFPGTLDQIAENTRKRKYGWRDGKVKP